MARDGQANRQAAPSGRARRTKAAVMTGVVCAAATATLVLIGIVADRPAYTARLDVTATRDQRLAPRTMRVMTGLEGTYRFVIAADLSSVDRRSRQRLVDVLQEMRRESGTVDYNLIDTGSPSGLDNYRRVLKDLIERDAATLRDQAAAVELAAGSGASLGAWLTDTLSPRLMEVREALPAAGQQDLTNRAYFEQSAAALRLAARDLGNAQGRAADHLRSRLGDLPLPATDRAASELGESLANAVNQLAALAREMKRFADSGPGNAQDITAGLLPQVEQRRDQAAVVMDSMRRLKRPDVLRITDVLRTASAALVIGPPGKGVTALDLASLLPRQDLAQQLPDSPRRTEELITSGLASLANPLKPIVVIVHSEPRGFLDSVPLAALRERLALRGIDLLEWPALAESEPAALASANPMNDRPVVYVCISPDTSSGAGRSDQGLNGPQRAGKLGEVLTKLVDGGKAVMVNLNPSVLPTYGEPDPIGASLTKFGLVAESGRPLLKETITPQGRIVETAVRLQPPEGSHAVSSAITGLPTVMTWPVALSERPLPEAARVSVAPLITLAAGPGVWTESQWLRLWQTPARQRAWMPDLPVFDEGRDGRWPTGQPKPEDQSWTLAAAAERSVVGQPTQRLIAVGSNAWFTDLAVAGVTEVDGRVMPINPGNLEFFEAGVYWLAGQDSLIAQSPSAQAVAVIQAMDAKTISRVRWGVIAGLPGLILALGISYRLIRG